jgi:hypothetical protein
MIEPMALAIWDLDNCLSDDSGRIGTIDWSTNDPEKRYAAYHERCDQDPCCNRDLFNEVSMAKNLEPLFITGRPEAVRAKTIAWIQQKLGVEKPNLLMRPGRCELSSVDLKSMLLDKFLAAAGESERVIHAAYDDHKGIIDMYRARGIPAHLVAIHALDAYRNESELVRRAPVEELGPVQGAGPNPEHRLDAIRYAVDGLRGFSRARRKRPDAAEVLEKMAATFRERNSQYRDNSRMVPKLVQVLFPDCVPSHLVSEEEWHLFELILVKLTRFATSGLTHVDSIHDIAPYAAMIESILQSKQEGTYK